MTEYIAFSGGVDSTALAFLMPTAIPLFTDTHWEFPHVYEHLDKFEQITGRKVIRIENTRYPGGMPKYIEFSKYLPNNRARYCTRMFKIDPVNEYLQDGDILNVALRADELERTGNLSENIIIKYPLREMGYTRLDCVKVCIENDLLPRYPPYAARGGCIGCFYKRKSEVIAMQMLIPEVVDELRKLEETVQDERGKYFHMFPHMNMSIADIQAQQPLFDFSEAYGQAQDTSDYGEACGLFCNR